MSRLNVKHISQNVFTTSLDTIDLLVPRSSRFVQRGNGLYTQLHLKQTIHLRCTSCRLPSDGNEGWTKYCMKKDWKGDEKDRHYFQGILILFSLTPVEKKDLSDPYPIQNYFTWESGVYWELGFYIWTYTILHVPESKLLILGMVIP